jgi:hypothetical protein
MKTLTSCAWLVALMRRHVSVAAAAVVIRVRVRGLLQIQLSKLQSKNAAFSLLFLASSRGEATTLCPRFPFSLPKKQENIVLFSTRIATSPSRAPRKSESARCGHVRFRFQVSVGVQGRRLEPLPSAGRESPKAWSHQLFPPA